MGVEGCHCYWVTAALFVKSKALLAACCLLPSSELEHAGLNGRDSSDGDVSTRFRRIVLGQSLQPGRRRRRRPSTNGCHATAEGHQELCLRHAASRPARNNTQYILRKTMSSQSMARRGHFCYNSLKTVTNNMSTFDPRHPFRRRRRRRRP